MMLNQAGAATVKKSPAALPSETVVIDTQFGSYEFEPAQTIIMPHGLVGFADHQLFGLANLPAPVPEDFKLLQSLAEPAISFIVMPMELDAALRKIPDLEEVCGALGLPRDEVHVMFLCTIRPKDSGDGIDMWANLRAPILFEIKVQKARQYVLPNSDYPLRYPLDQWNGVI